MGGRAPGAPPPPLDPPMIKEPSRHEKDRKQHSNRQERERTFPRDEEVQYSEKRETERSRSAKREKERERERSHSARRRSRSRSDDRKRANVSTQVQPTSRNVSVNCPSPIVLSPPTRRKKQVWARQYCDVACGITLIKLHSFLVNQVNRSKNGLQPKLIRYDTSVGAHTPNQSLMLSVNKPQMQLPKSWNQVSRIK